MRNPNQIFISYSRVDLDFAEKLDRNLTNDGFETWRDLTDEQGGESWWNQIRTAISSSGSLVLCLSLDALSSKTVIDEFKYARQVGARVIPVIAQDIDFRDFAKVPRAIRRIHCMDFRESAPNHSLVWSAFLNQLKSPYEGLYILNEAPLLDQPFAERPAIRKRILELLLDESGYDPVKSHLVLYGNGGFGKTTIARAICHEANIAQAFSDGILWFTLGQEPDLLRQVLDQIQYLTGHSPSFSTLNLAIRKLHDLLNDRDVLIVVDDVWQKSDAETLLQLGPSCSFLFTSRLQNLVLSVSGSGINIDEMQLQESVSFLEKLLETRSSDADVISQLAQTLSNWPILLGLAGAFLRELINLEHKSLTEAIQELLKLLKDHGFTALDQASEEGRQKSISITIDLSIERLKKWRERYLELCIFPKDVEIPFTAIQKLWQITGGLSELDTQLALRAIHNLSLLSQYDFSTRCIRLHDIVQEYLSHYFSEEGLSALHAKLIEGWGNPFALPDLFAWRYYSYHMAQAQYREHLFSLVCDFRWIQAKIRATDVPSLITDFDVARMALLPFPMGSMIIKEGIVHLSPSDPAYFGDAEVQQARQARYDTLWLIHSAILLSAHILGMDQNQLSGQLIGRLLSYYSTDSVIAALVDVARVHAVVPCLIPILPSLEQAGRALLRTFDFRGGNSHRLMEARGMGLAADGKHVYISRQTSDNAILEALNLDTHVVDFVLLGPRTSITTLAVSGDGRYLVTGSIDHNLQVWDCVTKQPIHTLVGHSDSITTVAITNDGRYAASGSSDHTIRIWDIQTGQLVHTLEGHTDSVWSIVLTPDMQNIISASQDCTLKIWQISTGDLLQTFTDHEKAVTCVALRGNIMFSASEDGLIKVRDLLTGEIIRSFRVIYHSTTALLPIGQDLLAVGSLNSVVGLWNLETGKMKTLLAGHSGPIRLLSTDTKFQGNYLLSGSQDGTLKLWDWTKADLSSIENYGAPVSAIAFTSNSQHVISGSAAGKLKVMDIGEPIQVHTINSHVGKVVGIMPVADSQYVLSVAEDGKLKLWNIYEDRLILEQNVGATSILSMCWIDDNQIILATDSMILSRETKGEEVVVTVSLNPKLTFRIYDLQSNNWAKVWDVTFDFGIFPQLLSGGHRAVSVTGTAGNPLVILWNTSTGEIEQSIAAPMSTTRALSIPHDQKHILIVEDSKVARWDLETNKLEDMSLFHYGEIKDLVISADGKYVVSVSDDKKAKIWDYGEDKLIVSFDMDNRPTCCAISSDNSIIAVGDNLGLVHLLNFVERDR